MIWNHAEAREKAHDVVASMQAKFLVQKLVILYMEITIIFMLKASCGTLNVGILIIGTSMF